MTGCLAAASVVTTKTQVAYGASGAGSEVGAVATISPAYPSGITAGGFLLAHVAGNDSVGFGATTPSGWTLIKDSGSATSRAYAFYKISDGTESGTLAITISTDTGAQARIHRYTKASGFEAAGSSRTAAGGTSFTNVNVTTTGPLEEAIQLESFLGASTTVADSTGESGADYTQPVAVYTGGGTFGGMAIQNATVASAAAITGGTATIGASRTDRIVLAFAIVP